MSEIVGRPRLARACAILAALGIVLASCSSTPGQRTPPVGSLPDPAVLMPGTALSAILGGAPNTPSCRYAESQYRCIWTDPANPERRLRVTVWQDPTIARQAIEGDHAQPVSVPGATEAAAVIGDGEVVVWSVVAQRGLEVGWTPDDPGNEAAHLAAAVAAAAAMAATISP